MTFYSEKQKTQFENIVNKLKEADTKGVDLIIPAEVIIIDTITSHILPVRLYVDKTDFILVTDITDSFINGDSVVSVGVSIRDITEDFIKGYHDII